MQDGSKADREGRKDKKRKERKGKETDNKTPLGFMPIMCVIRR
jgi:hypothetical protein